MILIETLVYVSCLNSKCISLKNKERRETEKLN